MQPKELYQFCETERQREILQAVDATNTRQEAADSLGISVRNVRMTLSRIRKNAERCGFDPKRGREYGFATPGQPVSGYSTLVRLPEGDPHGRVLEWVKTNRSLVEQLDSAKAAVHALCADIKPSSPVEYSGQPVDGDEDRARLVVAAPGNDRRNIFGRTSAQECANPDPAP